MSQQSVPEIRAVIFDLFGVVAHSRIGLVGEDHDVVFNFDRAVIDQIKDLRDAGITTGLLSNSERHELWREPLASQLEALFDHVGFSSDCGWSKPDPRIFHWFGERMKTPVEHCLFVDDLSANVDGAISGGMNGLVFSPDEEFWNRFRDQIYPKRTKP